jgi:hypothetical protein
MIHADVVDPLSTNINVIYICAIALICSPNLMIIPPKVDLYEGC